MRYMELTLETPPAELDQRCEELAALGVDGFVIESEEDFRDFLENNRQYWDYVDRELEQRFAGASRIKFYLTDDGEGRALLEKLRAAYPRLSLAYTPRTPTGRTTGGSTISPSPWGKSWWWSRSGSPFRRAAACLCAWTRA